MRSAAVAYAFPDEAWLATMSAEEKVAEYHAALAAGWSDYEARGTIWPERDVA